MKIRDKSCSTDVRKKDENHQKGQLEPRKALSLQIDLFYDASDPFMINDCHDEQVYISVRLS